MDWSIKVEQVSKLYLLGETFQHDTVRDLIAEKWRGLFVKQSPAITNSRQLWALKDVSFEVKSGDIVGVIGGNGAGKSTLLKLLSGVTHPTTGCITLKGRVASLLEVGTGFHPELTGRDNVYLNGAILGMTAGEIRDKFNDIVAFAELDKFMDTPVKRYSSGMYLRLGFAVAAFLETDILVIDEILAVGDMSFQQKCLGKVESVGAEGRTVFFVSHNMGMVSRLCNRAIYLSEGHVEYIGPVDEAISRYFKDKVGKNQSGCLEFSEPCYSAVNTKTVFFKKISITNQVGNATSELDIRQPFYVELEYEVPVSLRGLEITFRIDTNDGRALLTSSMSDSDPESLSRERQGIFKTRTRFPPSFLMPGTYLLSIGAHHPMVKIFDLKEHVLSFLLVDTGTKLTQYPNSHKLGVVMADLKWQEERKCL